MKSITLRSHVGEDGMLNLQLPLDITNSDLEVVVIIQPISKVDPKGQTKLEEE